MPKGVEEEIEVVLVLEVKFAANVGIASDLAPHAGIKATAVEYPNDSLVAWGLRFYEKTN